MPYRELSDSSVLMKEMKSLLTMLPVGHYESTKLDYLSAPSEIRVCMFMWVHMGTCTFVEARDQPQV